MLKSTLYGITSIKIIFLKIFVKDNQAIKFHLGQMNLHLFINSHDHNKT